MAEAKTGMGRNRRSDGLGRSAGPAAVLASVCLPATLAGCGPARQSLPVTPVAASCAKEPTCRIRPVDARTLADRRGFASLDFEGHYVFAVSPDSRRLAAITWPVSYTHLTLPTKA